MGQEIELKFLVDGAKLPELPKPEHYEQAYLCLKPAIRVRIVNGAEAFLTAKGEGMKGRTEIEFPIPLDKARELAALSTYRTIHKDRHKLLVDGMTWEIDFYHGDLEGLITAEIELDSEGQAVSEPDFVTEDVTDRPEYKNSSLAAHGRPAEG